ncbi:MAG: hypothetical protein SO253_01030 [Bacilli bacterium]|nr:hypothetical protein [Bacilli bacterium]
MDTKQINEHFRYYLENETQFISTERYVFFAKKCQNTYSYFFANLLFNICSDFESLIRTYFKKDNDEPIEINNIIKLIKSDERLVDIFDEKAIFKLGDYGELSPLKIEHNRKTNKDSFKWWGAYNKIKHNKASKIHQASQINVLNALAALYILNKYIQVRSCSDIDSDFFIDDKYYFKLNVLKNECIPMNRVFAVPIK